MLTFMNIFRFNYLNTAPLSAPSLIWTCIVLFCISAHLVLLCTFPRYGSRFLIDSHTAPPPAPLLSYSFVNTTTKHHYYHYLLIHLLTAPPAPLFYFFICVMCSFCLFETHTNYIAKSTEAATCPCDIIQCSMFSSPPFFHATAPSHS